MSVFTTQTAPKDLREVLKIILSTEDLPIASLETLGLVQLSNSLESDDETKAVTPSVIKNLKQVVDSVYAEIDTLDGKTQTLGEEFQSVYGTIDYVSQRVDDLNNDNIVINNVLKDLQLLMWLGGF